MTDSAKCPSDQARAVHSCGCARALCSVHCSLHCTVLCVTVRPVPICSDGSDVGTALIVPSQGSVIADFVHCGETIRTSTAWKCHQFGDAGAPDGWKTADFDDSAWPDAGDVGDNGVEPWGHRVDISGEAHWIWTQDSRGHDQIYCRYVSQHHHLDCPAAQARYWTDYPVPSTQLLTFPGPHSPPVTLLIGFRLRHPHSPSFL